MKTYGDGTCKKSNKFCTQDFYISCVLKSTGLQLLEIVREDNGRSTFVFENPDRIAESKINKHWNNELEVNSLDLVEAISQLKTRIFSRV